MKKYIYKNKKRMPFYDILSKTLELKTLNFKTTLNFKL